MKNEQHIENKFGHELERRIWITRGSRFNAHQRLMCKQSWSVAAISLLSLYVIAFTLLQFFPALSLTSKQINVISFSAIVLSLFILVIRLLESSKSYQIKAMQFHKCASELSLLYDKIHQILDNADNNTSKLLTEISIEYATILDKCPENHDVVDFDDFKIQHRQEFKLGVIDRIWFPFIGWIKSYSPYLLLIIVPPVVIIILLFLLQG